MPRYPVNYTKVPNEIITDQNLEPAEKLLYILILKYSSKNGVCWASQKKLAKEIGRSDRHVRTLLKELVKKGYIEVIKQRNRKETNVYKPLFTVEGKSISFQIGSAFPPTRGSRFPTSIKTKLLTKREDKNIIDFNKFENSNELKQDRNRLINKFTI